MKTHRIFDKLLCAVAFAAAGLMTMPASAIFITHNGSTIVADDLQGHTTNTRPDSTPGSDWTLRGMARSGDGSSPPLTHGGLYLLDNDDLQSADVLVTDLDGVGVFPGAPQAAEGGVDGHTKYIWLDNAGDRPFAGVQFDPVSSGTLNAEFMLYVTEQRAQIQFGTVPENEGDSGSHNLRLTPSSTTTGWDLNNSGATRFAILGDGNYPVDEWMKVGVTYNFVAGDDDTVEMVVNGVSSGVIDVQGGVGGSINWIYVNQSHNTAGDIFLGSTVPEPASLVLLSLSSLGGLAVVRRRRRT